MLGEQNAHTIYFLSNGLPIVNSNAKQEMLICRYVCMLYRYVCMYYYAGIEIGLGGRDNPVGEDAWQSRKRCVDVPQA